MTNTKPKFRRVVVKIGSSVLSGERGLKRAFFAQLATQVSILRERCIETVIVSSGAVAAAMATFGAKKKPESIPEKQAYAAFGQPMLMQRYIAAFARRNLRVAQILLTYPDLENHGRFINARRAMADLLKRGIVPVINENDSVSVDELKFGDNDRLSAMVAHLAEADLLVILSHVDGLYSGDPGRDRRARLIPEIGRIDEHVRRLVFQGDNHRGTGGMATKLKAAQTCLDYGVPVFITNGARTDCLTGALDSTSRGTWFKPHA